MLASTPCPDPVARLGALRHRLMAIHADLGELHQRLKGMAGAASGSAGEDDVGPFPGPFRTLSDEQKRLVRERVTALASGGGLEAVRRFLRRVGAELGDKGLSALHVHAAAALKDADAAACGRLLEEAVEICRSTGSLRALLRYYRDQGRLDDAARLADELERLEGSSPNPATVKLIKSVREKQEFWTRSGDFFDRLARFRRPVSRPDSRTMVYVLHNSLPHATGGYATRSHGILRGVQKTGYRVLAMTRPGFPVDGVPRATAGPVAPQDEIEGIVYRRALGAGRRKDLTEPAYIESAADCLEAEFEKERPAIVHAASNYRTGAPAMIAAHRLGIPFVYEVRGFWEITRASRDPEFRHSAAYAAMARLEAETASRADAVLTLTTAMKEELVRRGVPEDRITVVHNAVDPERFRPLKPSRPLAKKLGLPAGVPVIGYVGSHVEYEGLDLLVQACAKLRQRGVDFRLLLVGDGSVTDDVLKLAAESGVKDLLVYTGRIPHEEVEEHYSLIDICPFPRKPWPVCELVSPMKPFEALAMSKAVIVANTHALAEIIDDGRTGLHFNKGDVDDLTDKLSRCVMDAGLRSRLGKAGREWVTEHRTWDAMGRKVVEVYQQVLADRRSKSAA